MVGRCGCDRRGHCPSDPGHDDPEMDHAAMGQGEMPASMAEVQGPYTTVALDVAGMT